MQADYAMQMGKVSVAVETDKDYTIATVNGAEIYQLTHKESGRVSLAAFESPVAAKRYFAGTKEFFFTKIL